MRDSICPLAECTVNRSNWYDPYLILGRPRLIGREDLANPAAEIERVVTLAARELG
jgi:hypothetical protein